MLLMMMVKIWFKRIVKMQKERGALVIISCHEMQTLEELSDEIVRLKEGRICE